jgi:hypothetical protein
MKLEKRIPAELEATEKVKKMQSLKKIEEAASFFCIINTS